MFEKLFVIYHKTVKLYWSNYNNSLNANVVHTQVQNVLLHVVSYRIWDFGIYNRSVLWVSNVCVTCIIVEFTYSKSEPFKGNDPIASNSIKYLKQEAFQILEAKCNVCHRRQNPFMIFSVKNMERRASKIYKQVFISKRMPKGDQVKLTSNEHAILKEWLINLNSATKKIH